MVIFFRQAIDVLCGLLEIEVPGGSKYSVFVLVIPPLQDLTIRHGNITVIVTW